MTSWYSSK